MSTDTQPPYPPSPQGDAGGAARPTSSHHGDASEARPTTDEVMEAAQARIQLLEAESQDMRERWMRAEAEMANLRTRAKREADEARQYAVQKFARDVAETAETLRRGLDSLPSAGNGEPEIVARLREGFSGIERSFVAMLERHGVRREDPVGAMFDPNMHQAMAEQETAEHPPGTVVQAWTPSWTLNGRLLRPAMVTVAKAPAGAAANPSGTAGAKLNTSA